MKVIGYIRVSSDQQDVQQQEHLLLKYAQERKWQIDYLISVEVSSRKDTRLRRIEELLDLLSEGDILLVAELSRLGRNMYEVIQLVNQLSELGVEVILLKLSEILSRSAQNKAWRPPKPKESLWADQKVVEIKSGHWIHYEMKLKII